MHCRVVVGLLLKAPTDPWTPLAHSQSDSNKYTCLIGNPLAPNPKVHPWSDDDAHREPKSSQSRVSIVLERYRRSLLPLFLGHHSGHGQLSRTRAGRATDQQVLHSEARPVVAKVVLQAASVVRVRRVDPDDDVRLVLQGGGRGGLVYARMTTRVQVQGRMVRMLLLLLLC